MVLSVLLGLGPQLQGLTMHALLVIFIFPFLTLPLPPLDFIEAAKEIVEAGVFLNKYRLCPATSGNFSRRLSEGLIAVTASGKHKGELTVDDILMVDLQGSPRASSLKPSAETLLHTSIYNLYPEVGAVLHTHSLNGIVLTQLISNSELITEGYEIHKIFPGIKTHKSTVVTPIFENSQDIAALADEVSDFLKVYPNTYGFLIRGHGFYTWGRDMQEAKNRIEAFEHLFESEWKLHLIMKKS